MVPNLYPAFEGDQPFVVENRGPVFTQATAGGIHEILVLSPEHDASWAELSDEQASLVMAALRDRIEEHSQQSNLRYSQAIVNCGREAGASLEHPHGQLLGMSFVPRELSEEVARFAEFAGGCLLCTTVDAEENAACRVVYADDRTVVVCPFWSAVPYEMLVIPRTHSPHLYRSPTEDLVSVGSALRDCLEPPARPRRRRRLQHRLPLGPLPGQRALPLARSHVAQGDHPAPVSSWAPASPSTSWRPSRRPTSSASRSAPGSSLRRIRVCSLTELPVDGVEARSYSPR